MCLSCSLGTEEDRPQHLAPHTSCNPKALEDVRATRWKERGTLISRPAVLVDFPFGCYRSEEEKMASELTYS